MRKFLNNPPLIMSLTFICFVLGLLFNRSDQLILSGFFFLIAGAGFIRGIAGACGFDFKEKVKI